MDSIENILKGYTDSEPKNDAVLSENTWKYTLIFIFFLAVILGFLFWVSSGSGEKSILENLKNPAFAIPSSR